MLKAKHTENPLLIISLKCYYFSAQKNILPKSCRQGKALLQDLAGNGRISKRFQGVVRIKTLEQNESEKTSCPCQGSKP
ncbi:MAG: hypothetical protein DCC43_08485 [Candidatus Brocadia sp.]|nr:hypothetical protein [Candidatus Brocadia sp. AMX3]RIJ99413.1 MAG: hypothetical protein DCC43_08485 [Candidatus Brocadia sp.]